MTNINSTEMTKEATLEAIEYICQDIEPNVLVSLSNDILTFHGIRKDERNDHVELAATTALLNSANFEKESERHVCMQGVCKNALSAGKKICYNVEMQKLLKFLKTVKRDFYYQQVLLDLYHQMKIFMNSNGYASKGLPDLEHLIKLRSIRDVIHSSKIEQWKKLFNYIKSNDLSEFVKPLKELIEEYEEFKKFPSYTAKVGYILDKIFLIGQNCRDYTLEEKREIAALIVPCLQPLKVCIKSIYRTPRTRLDCYIRQRRSALQFIAEEYSRFPLDGKILANDLEKVSLKESIEILDNLIEEYRDLSSEDSDTDLEEAGSTLMPRSHSWWTK
ncbi:uncharacterized protein [Parasteatoda tepidariorum]|uniref:uncharacterized protein n=1 Tax=Parasteatoda tepidariorum TaxID=114398 RepID=UPI001C71C4F1|nr:uncharacterized protein LOC107454306 [Parasteatoda tepidariorum]